MANDQGAANERLSPPQTERCKLNGQAGGHRDRHCRQLGMTPLPLQRSVPRRSIQRITDASLSDFNKTIDNNKETGPPSRRSVSEVLKVNYLPGQSSRSTGKGLGSGFLEVERKCLNLCQEREKLRRRPPQGSPLHRRVRRPR